QTTRWQSCNVLQAGTDARRLWQFATGNSQVALSAEQRLVSSAPLPAKLITKDWRTLWQKKLNIAWLPAEQVFLRIIHLPKCEPEELRSMVELQLEKLSPLPVNQIVWSFEVVPRNAAAGEPVESSRRRSGHGRSGRSTQSDCVGGRNRRLAGVAATLASRRGPCRCRRLGVGSAPVDQRTD